ncbi:Arc family DNA-binding protein [Phaeobacter gallaeciensis]|uniref:Arc-like DNA binding protein domain protein n=1 Tax=Phaeobacter gallaeciensis TaxID=60890 RepID=A0AAD0EDG0_9RHOB|nr:Arc family DNA-binding protein [Phaeobacter gallaeciensis]AHD09998.1 Arc-like DNA binding protein domain protein [Phaeobacter gallaeciensis DSM 26640]ATE93262.1 Arc-like DNA binding protein domain protein [Phaeobacter gallaeciensis]ATE96917.1 Arc-like DNA binding protein domain protein [Phaeobacter gallaeciensis]ATF01926.1 Arc-like DNA binding protein domain protein [Phaeobacter gallaeciensis]ATF06306.1 Arc-like DNA binding protein domain protein [Phaeobacter gallaeciensis]
MSDNDSKYPSELAERFQVRLPEGMRDRIKAAAAENNRSMNAEIVHALQLYLDFDFEKHPSATMTEEQKEEISETYHRILQERLMEKMVQAGWKQPED